MKNLARAKNWVLHSRTARMVAIAPVLAMLPLMSVSCRTTGHSSSDPKVINGTAVTNPADPVAMSTVALLNAGNSQYCSGVIIDHSLILTADHCVALSLTQINAGGMKVGFGLGPNYTVVRNVTQIIHPKAFGLMTLGTQIQQSYLNTHPGIEATLTDLMAKQKAGTLTPDEQARLTQMTQELMTAIAPIMNKPNVVVDDIAMLKIDGDTPPGFVDVNIASAAEVQAAQGWTRVAGYGITGDGKTDNGVLRWAWMGLNSFNAPSQELLLTPYQGSNTCHGDSGGPAYIQTPTGVLRLLSLVSRSEVVSGASDISCTSAGVETDVMAHSVWVGCAAAQLNGGAAHDPACGAFQSSTEVLNPPVPGSSINPAQCLNLTEQLKLLVYALAVKQGTALDATQTEEYNQLAARFQSAGACPVAAAGTVTQ